MKILLISSGILEVPPLGYGGLEQIVADLAIELDKIGHTVCVVCPNESTIGNIGNIDAWVCGEKNRNAHQWEREAFEKYKNRLIEFDIIHDHSWTKPSYLAKIDNPKLNVISTLHGMLGPGSPYGSPPPVDKPCFVGISKDHAQSIASFLGIASRFCYNGIDLDKYRFKQEKSDRYLFLARINPYKAPHVFIDLMKQANKQGDIVGDDILVEDPNYVEKVLMMCNDLQGQIKYWGGATRDRAMEFFQNAKAYIAPLLPPWREPFNLCVIESMACGTPVIGTANGALPELIEHGKSGFVCQTIFDMLQYLNKVNEIRPEECRQRAEQFSRKRMVDTYLELYNEVIKGGW